MGALLMSVERVVRVVNRGRVYQQAYTAENSAEDALRLLQDELVKLYQAALEVMADAGDLFDKNTARRTMHAILFPEQTSGLLAELADRETNVQRAIQACGAVADARLLDMLRNVNAPLARIDRSVEALLERGKRDEWIMALNWVSRIKTGDQHNSIVPRRMKDTCQWLLE